MSKSIFEKIADRELPGYVVWEDETFIAFLTIAPLTRGHTLVVPKENWGDYLFGLADEQYQSLMKAAKQVANLLDEKIACDRILVIVEGFEVPHVHIHLIPAPEGLNLSQVKPLKLTEQEFKAIQKQIID